MKALAKEKDMLEREKWDLRRQTKEATEQANMLRSQLDMKENRIKELEAELTMVSHPAHGHSHNYLNHKCVTQESLSVVVCVAKMQTRCGLAILLVGSYQFKHTQ